MGLSKKTFLYSILLATVMVLFIIGYFVFMLPSLYVDYVMDSNLKSAIEIQKGYLENGSYENLGVKNSVGAFTFEIPKEGNTVYVTGEFFKLTAEIQDDELKNLLNDLRGVMDGDVTIEEFQTELGNFDKGKFDLGNLFPEDYPIRVQLEDGKGQRVYRDEGYKTHMIAENLIVYEAYVSDDNYGYTTYTAVGWTQDSFVITILPTMTPKMEEITPVVMGSLPMIIAVVFLLVLISSRLFSGKIVNPVIRLAGYAENARLAEKLQIEPFRTECQDEIGVLAEALNDLYEKLRENYLELEEKNRMLEEKNERQEVFLRASSHQLKTPITAALLLVEGMINEVGKYREVKEYLPQVKEQLLSMRKIVEDILSLNYRAEHPEAEDVALESLVEEVIRSYQVQIEGSRLNVVAKGSQMISTDREIMKKIVDNLISNAVQYTPMGKRIEIEIGENSLVIRNYGAAIDEKLLPNIFDPFVSSEEGKKGKGLGLYIVSYYGRLLGCRVQIENREDHVFSKLIFAGCKEKGEI